LYSKIAARPCVLKDGNGFSYKNLFDFFDLVVEILILCGLSVKSVWSVVILDYFTDGEGGAGCKPAPAKM
jgi:hypothetical protein